MTLRAAVKKGLRRRRTLVLLSDLDGTLTPIRDRPQAVRLSARAGRILARLARHPRCRVGIVSGRSLTALKQLVRIPGAAYAGCHGLELAWRGVRFRHPGAVALAPLLGRIAGELLRRTSRLSGVLVEPKGLTVGLHYRLASPRDVPALRRIIDEILASAPALELLAGKKVLELRPHVAWGKGQAVQLLRSLLAGSLRRRALTIYLGDDATDEEVFRALRGKAICVAVGRRRTRAAYRLSGSAAVERLLASLAETLEVDVRR